ncbi:MAG: DUF4419 domain-containing protein [Planctomycetaceae bacterium]|nr:DUF4419 domain-containing protein [Planctomycetaceae bacterium]
MSHAASEDRDRESGVTITLSRDLPRPRRKPPLDHAATFRKALRRPIESLWKPRHPLVQCGDDHALVQAVHDAFFDHHPLVLSPDVIWLTLARGFSLHVGLHAEELRHRFVSHSGKLKLIVNRPDFLPGGDNPWPEAFEAFSTEIGTHVGKLRDFVRCDFTTTGPIERAVGDLMVMDTFQPYFEYEMLCGCGIPRIHLKGTVEDWKSIRNRAAVFGEFGLETWCRALDPILAQFVAAASGCPDTDFWESFFRYHGGSGPSVMTGWINTLFPYHKDSENRLKPNPYLEDWERRLEVDSRQDWRESWHDPQGAGMGVVPSALASVPIKVHWGSRETMMRFVGGLMGVSQEEETLALEPQCGWAIVYEEPVDPIRSRSEIARDVATLQDLSDDS